MKRIWVSRTSLLLILTLILSLLPVNQVRAARPGPVFISPRDGELLSWYGEQCPRATSHHECWFFWVEPIEGARYLWGFEQFGELVWENLRDDGRLTRFNSYMIHHHLQPTQIRRFSLGPVTVHVRAWVDNQWTEKTTITIDYSVGGVTAAVHDHNGGLNMIRGKHFWRWDIAERRWTREGWNVAWMLSGDFPGKGEAEQWFWEGPGVTAAFLSHNGELNIISRDHFWRWKNNQWIREGWHVVGLFDAPDGKHVPGKGYAERYPWEGPGITAAFHGAAGKVNIVSGTYFWRWGGNGWTYNGYPMSLMFPRLPSKGKAPHGYWEEPGVTAAFYGAVGNLNIISGCYFWRWDVKLNDWTIQGEHIDKMFGGVPGLGISEAGFWQRCDLSLGYREDPYAKAADELGAQH